MAGVFAFMNNIKTELQNRIISLKVHTVNSKDESIPTVNSNNSLTVEDKIQTLLDEENITPEGVAEMLADGLDDRRSIPYWVMLAKNSKQGILLEVLHYVKDVARTKEIRNKPAYFLAILRKKGIKTKFKTT